MDNIERAISRAKTDRPAVGVLPAAPLQPLQSDQCRFSPGGQGVREVRLNREHLERERLIAFDRLDERSKSFDMLRTQVLQTMESQGAQILSVTSPTAGCGKTFNAINLAMSIARQPERSALLIDLDLQGPQIARRLGIECETGLVDVLEGKVAYQDALLQARIGAHDFLLLPSKGTNAGRSEWPSVKTLGALLRELKQEDLTRTIILDLPPLLSGDEVISILPFVEGVLFVVSAGITTQAHIKECEKHLQASAIVRVVLNKSPEPGIAPYGSSVPEEGRRRLFRRRR
jgi:Mrp family chromosome partitioning ATPase